MNSPDMSTEAVIAATQSWLQKAVIGLNLCPFANAVHIRQRIRYAVSEASTTDDLLDDLERELKTLATTAPETVETTLLIHPRIFTDFLDYNDFLERADEFVEELGFAESCKSRAFIRSISSPEPSRTTSRITRTARLIRFSICCANRASTRRSRRIPRPRTST